MIGTGLLVHPSAAVAVGAHPQLARAILCHAQHGNRSLTVLFQSEVSHVLFIRRDSIQSVAVASNPQCTVTRHQYAHNTSIADGVRGTKLSAQITEGVRTNGLHEYTLL